VVEEVLVVLVSATLGAGTAATGLARAGTVGAGSEATWRSNAKAPTITTAVIVPNAIPKCLTRLLPRKVYSPWNRESCARLRTGRPNRRAPTPAGFGFRRSY